MHAHSINMVDSLKNERPKSYKSVMLNKQAIKWKSQPNAHSPTQITFKRTPSCVAGAFHSLPWVLMLRLLSDLLLYVATYLEPQGSSE